MSPLFLWRVASSRTTGSASCIGSWGARVARGSEQTGDVVIDARADHSEVVVGNAVERLAAERRGQRRCFGANAVIERFNAKTQARCNDRLDAAPGHPAIFGEAALEGVDLAA